MAKKETRTVSEEYERIGRELLGRHPELASLNEFVEAGRVRIVFLESDRAKRCASGAVYADCMRVPESMRWTTDADFAVTVYKPNVSRLNSGQRKILMLHELMHVGAETNDNGDLRTFLIPHSVQEFRYILDRYGADWDMPGKQIEFDFGG